MIDAAECFSGAEATRCKLGILYRPRARWRATRTSEPQLMVSVRWVWTCDSSSWRQVIGFVALRVRDDGKPSLRIAFY